MNKRFVATTAIGVVLATASFAQSPVDSRRQEQQRTQDPSTNTTRSPESSRQPTTAQRPAQRTQQNTAQSPTSRPADNAQAPAQPRQSGTTQTTKSNTNVNASTNVSAQEQITRVAQSIARLNVQPLTNVNFSVAVGTAVPRDVRLQTLPPDIVRIVPEFRNHSFVVVQDDIVIIDPSTYRIVSVLPKSGGRTTAASSPPPRQAQAKATFTEKERAAIRKHTNVKRGNSLS